MSFKPPSSPRSPSRSLPIATRPELGAIYRKLGATPLDRERKLGEILLTFYRRMAEDVLLGFFFDGKDLPTIAMRQKQFLMRAMGASPSYQGKAPAQAHEQMAPILTGHFDRRLVLLEEVLRQHGVDAEDIRTWLGFENSFRAAIVQS